LVLDRFCFDHVENSKTKLIFLGINLNAAQKNGAFFAKVEN